MHQSVKFAAIFGGYDPIIALGDDLIADWWAGYGVTLAAGVVSGWADRKMGYEPTQVVESFRAAYGAAAFGGKPGITPDGLDDNLELTPAPATFPDGAEEGESWELLEETAPAADTAAKTHTMYGNTINDGRRVMRVVSGGQIFERSQVGSGATSVTRNTPAIALGRHVVRTVFRATNTGISADTITDLLPAAVVPATTLTRFRFFATSALTPSAFSGAIYNRKLLTRPLSDAKAAALMQFLKAQGGIA